MMVVEWLGLKWTFLLMFLFLVVVDVTLESKEIYFLRSNKRANNVMMT
jgi:hypothetical protein